MKLIIIRGLPGSGKTTFANLITNEVHAAHYQGFSKWKPIPKEE